MPDPINPISIVDGDTHINKYSGKKIYIGGNEYLPVGTVLMYNGSGIANAGSRSTPLGDEQGDTINMPGWYVCNGNASTPNLLNKFVRAEAASGNLGGSDTANHNHSAGSLVAKVHVDNTTVTVGRVAAAQWTGTETVSGASTTTKNPVWGAGLKGNSATRNINNRPAYYSLIFIIRME